MGRFNLLRKKVVVDRYVGHDSPTLVELPNLHGTEVAPNRTADCVLSSLGSVTMQLTACSCARRLVTDVSSMLRHRRCMSTQTSWGASTSIFYKHTTNISASCDPSGVPRRHHENVHTDVYVPVNFRTYVLPTRFAVCMSTRQLVGSGGPQ
ncbi:hypothetical protein BD413DRAFT_114562 [Trametes elegans]|nr:hypothetical protein BD413DRAFT_114562 [Trametes elegans]